jgi:hypothetical protein
MAAGVCQFGGTPAIEENDMVRKYVRHADPEHVRAVRQAAGRRRWQGVSSDEHRQVSRRGGEAARARWALAQRLLAEHDATSGDNAA